MRALRTAGLVMLGIAAVDGILDAVESLASRITGADEVNLWPLLLGIGLVVLLVDQLIEYRAAILKCCRGTADWIQSKIGG